MAQQMMKLIGQNDGVIRSYQATAAQGVELFWKGTVVGLHDGDSGRQ